MIRIATPDDAAALASLHAKSFAEPWDTAAMVALLEGEGVIALTAPDGFILVRAVASEAEILTLAVDPAARRHGLGRALVEAGGQAAVNAGAESLFLEVAQDNAAALALYARCGFEPVGRRRGYYRRAGGEAVDALVLRQTLIPSDA